MGVSKQVLHGPRIEAERDAVPLEWRGERCWWCRAGEGAAPIRVRGGSPSAAAVE